MPSRAHPCSFVVRPGTVYPPLGRARAASSFQTSAAPPTNKAPLKGNAGARAGRRHGARPAGRTAEARRVPAKLAECVASLRGFHGLCESKEQFLPDSKRLCRTRKRARPPAAWASIANKRGLRQLRGARLLQQSRDAASWFVWASAVLDPLGQVSATQWPQPSLKLWSWRMGASPVLSIPSRNLTLPPA